MEVSEFRAGRFFYQTVISGNGSGWFFNAREGAFGPYESRLQAQFELELFIQNCIESNVTGGRNPVPVDTSGLDNDVEEIVAAPPPQDEVSTLGYFDKIRAAVRERASQYMDGMR